MPDFTGVAHVELTVRDADRSANWYERVLCMKRLGEFPEWATAGRSARVVHVMNPAAGLDFGLIQHESGEDGQFSEFRVGLDHLSLAVKSREELEKWVRTLMTVASRTRGLATTRTDQCLCFAIPTTSNSNFLHSRRRPRTLPHHLQS